MNKSAKLFRCPISSSAIIYGNTLGNVLGFTQISAIYSSKTSEKKSSCGPTGNNPTGNELVMIHGWYQC
jgi:hypothetical protein